VVFAYFSSSIDQERLPKIIKSTGLSDELLCSEPAHLATKDYKKGPFYFNNAVKNNPRYTEAHFHTIVR
jgi:hypothetical protein